jgi:hypothetical protein
VGRESRARWWKTAGRAAKFNLKPGNKNALLGVLADEERYRRQASKMPFVQRNHVVQRFRHPFWHVDSRLVRLGRPRTDSRVPSFG